MSHEVFRLHELKQKLQYKIESIAAAQNLFFLGTSDGKIVVYEVSPDSYDAQCVHIHTSKHKQPIRHVIPIVEKEILLVVVGDVILLHRLYSMSRTHLDRLPEDRLPELGTIKGTKDIIALHMKRHKGVYSLAVLQRKKVTIYEYKDQLQEFVVINDSLLIPDGAKSILWVGKNLIIGFRREYVFMDVTTGATDCLYPTGRTGAPLMLSLDPVPEILIGEDSTGIRALHDGSLVPGKSGMPWAALPSGATYIHPFLLTAHTSSCIEVRVPFLSTLKHSIQTESAASSAKNPSLCQTMNIKYAERIAQRPFADFDARLPTRETPSDAFRKDIVIALNSSNTVYLLQLIPLREQVLALASSKSFESALTLCQLCLNEVDQPTVDNLKTLFALWCFTSGHYKSSMHRFRDANADPRLVINLFPGFLTRRARESWRPPREHTVPVDNAELAEHMHEAVAAFIDYAIPLRGEYNHTASSSSSTAADQNGVVTEAIDTAIMKAYVVTRQEERLLRFFWESNFCSLSESELFLSDSGQWVALAALWYRHGRHESSLELLYALGTSGQRPATLITAPSLSPSSTLSNSTQKLPLDADFLRVLETLLSEITSTPTTGNDRNAGGDGDALSFTPQCVLETSLAAAFSVAPSATGDHRGKAKVDFLLRRCVGVVTSIRYLQLLPWEEYTTAKLINRYAPWILANVPPRWSIALLPISASAQQSQCTAAVLQLLSTDMRSIGHTRQDERVSEWLARLFGSKCNTYEDSTLHDAYWQSLAGLTLDPHGDTNASELARGRLRDFLRTSRFMDLRKAQVYFEQPAYRARAIMERSTVYQRLRMHEEAMRMFVYEVHEMDAARDYASRVSHEDGEDAFRILLRLLLNPKDAGAAPRLTEAIAILNQCDGVDPLAALPMLPDSTPVSQVADFLQRSLRDLATRRHHAAIHANVLESRVRQMEFAVARERSRRVVVDLGTCCAVCEKRLRPDTVFARFPNGVVVHQACMDDEHICSATSEDFRCQAEVLARAAL